MAQAGDIVVFGVASSGAVAQWDGHATPIGILLRWFTDPKMGYPEFGFDIYRARVPDTPPLPFNDLNVPLIQGKPSWNYGDMVTLSCAAGLHFAPSGQLGWWNLIVAPGAPVSVTFSSPAWLATVRVGSGNVTVVGRVNGTERRREDLKPAARLTWRTRGLNQLELSGDGTVPLIGYHLLGHADSWTHIAHRCLPVIDPLYRCAPQPLGSEADEARGRLPPQVSADWTTRFAGPFANLLPVIRRVAIGAPPSAIPPDPNHPDLRLRGDERAFVDLSAIDPHGARILGLAYDDPLNGALDGQEYVYKIVGRWLGKPTSIDLTGRRRIDPEILQRHGIELDFGRRGRGTSEITVRFAPPALDVSIELRATSEVDWRADDGHGGKSSGTVPAGSAVVDLSSVSTIGLTPAGSDPPVLTALRWTPIVEAIGLLPGIVATEPGPPPGPPSMIAVVVPADSPTSIATANLDWPITINADNSIPEGEPVSYQIAHRQLGSDPTAACPTPGAPGRADLVYQGAPIFVPSSLAQLPRAGRALHIDRNDGKGLSAGWWGWWVRGVDLFGRVSPPSPWVQAAVLDVAPPPAPIMVEAEWVQRNLPKTTVAVLGRSTEGARWLQSSQANGGLIASWAYGPDEAELRPDVDGFRLILRRPAPVAGAPADAALQYAEPWPAPIASFGPMAIRSDGTVSSAPASDPALEVTLSNIQRLPASPNAKDADPVRTSCITNLALDGGSGVFVGGTLSIAGTAFTVVANGDGTNLSIVVQHAASGPPKAGSARLIAPPKRLVEITTNLPALTPPTGLRARSGVIVIGRAGGARRLQVLHTRGGVFLCRANGSAITVGDPAAWFPVWSVALDDTGFGPATSDTVPVAHAQVAVRAVRAGGGASTPSAPLTVTAVDLTTPTVPMMNAITFDPTDTCARLASRADWYGKSRFVLSWAAQANRSFTVYRALGDEINRLDRIEYGKGGRRAQGFPQAADWPAGVYADTTRRSRVLEELAALTPKFAALTPKLAAVTAARAVADPDARAAALAAAQAALDAPQAALDAVYAAMTIDTQMLLARQDYAWPAFGALFGVPTEAKSYEDVLEGRSHGHWFYRVTSRTAAGMESTPCEPTPPICCPDVVPPAVPLAHMALADVAGVKLHWLASPDSDLDHYDIYASRDSTAVAELAGLTPVTSHTPSPAVGGVIIKKLVPRPPGEWCFWIVAVDNSGNRSAPSTMLRGKPLIAPPVAPTWQPPARTATGATLRWTHSNQRLACLVERRELGGGMWRAVSTWLPRGVYIFDDTPPDLTAGWEYRLRVRDHQGQVAASLPSVTLPGVP